MHGAFAESKRHRYVSSAACYLAWIVLSAGGFWCLVRLREIAVALSILGGTAAKLILVLDRFGLVLLGLAWIAAIGALESYLQAGLHTGRLLNRILRIAAIEAGFIILSSALEWVLQAVVTHT